MSIVDVITNAPWNKKIEILRVAKGWNQEQASEECGTTRKNYWRWESGIIYPRNNSRRAIGIAFGVSDKEIFNPETDKKVV